MADLDYRAERRGEAANQARGTAGLREALAQAEERIATLVKQSEAREQLLSSALAEATEELAACQARFAERRRLLEDVAQAALRVKQWEAERPKPAAFEAEHPPVGGEIEWNALQDLRYSREIPGLEGVLHVFHKEWFGIRAAVGSLPGDKAAITANRALFPDEIAELYQRVLAKNYKRIVFHGCSKNTSVLIEFFAKKGLSGSVYAIIHGSPGQWNNDFERNIIFDHLAQLNLGKIKRLHIMRAGFEFPSTNTFKPLVLNLSPRVEARRLASAAGHTGDRGTVFAPAWSTWQKNLYGSVIAASMCEKVRRIWIYEKKFSAPPEVMRKVTIQKYLSREQTFDLMSMSSICLNASLLDCHPMVNVEAQALGRPCIRGPLNLDALDDHPYVRLTNVPNVASMNQIKATVDKVLSAPSEELKALVQDYQAQSDAVASSRHLEFLEF